MARNLHLRRGFSGGLRTAMGAMVVAAGVCVGAGDVHAQPSQGQRTTSSRGVVQRGPRLDSPPGTKRGCTTAPLPRNGAIACTTMAWLFASEDPRSRAAQTYHDGNSSASSAALAKAMRLSGRLRSGELDKPMINAFEPTPLWKIESDNAIFRLLSDFTGINIVGRTYGTDRGELRAFRAMGELEASRDRATYMDVEEYVGHPDDNKVSAPYAAAGMSLTALTGVLKLLDRDEMEDSGRDARVRPSGWPPGLRIQGHFSLP